MTTAPFSVEVQAGEAISRLGVLGTTVSEAQEENVRAVSQRVVNSIRSRAPVDTGALKASYDYRIEVHGSEKTAVIGSDLEYAEYQEFGTSVMPAQPHVRPALEQHRDEIVSALGPKALQAGIDDA